MTELETLLSIDDVANLNDALDAVAEARALAEVSK